MCLSAAFPQTLVGDAGQVVAVMPDATLSPIGSFQVEVRGETLTIPTRIHNGVPAAESVRALPATQQTDHGVDEPWVVPFVVQLAGEYVIEILEAISRGLPGLAVPHSPQRRL